MISSRFPWAGFAWFLLPPRWTHSRVFLSFSALSVFKGTKLEWDGMGMLCQYFKFPGAPFSPFFFKSIKCLFKQHKVLLSAIALPSAKVMLQAWHYRLCWWNWISLSYWFWCILVGACGFCIDLSEKLLRSGWARSAVCVVWELTGALILCQQPVAHLDIDPLWGNLALIRYQVFQYLYRVLWP